MSPHQKILVPFVFYLLGPSLFAGRFSPENWPAEERVALERLEQRTRPENNRQIDGDHGLVAGTMSPIAARVGIDVLKAGGTAADAAAAMALTQVTTALGSFVSYAGIAQLVYYDAKSGRTYSMDAGWASYLAENEPKSIPGPNDIERDQGRKTLVPGFMAGLEAMQHRFGILPFADLFEPAIWYAQNGVSVSPFLAGNFRQREKNLGRTESGRRFLHQAGNQRPNAGDKFVQIDLARTLESVALHGAKFMYTGEWAQHYIEAVRSEGGKISHEDLERYQPIWQEPLSTGFAGHVVFGPGRSSEGGYQALAALNLIEELKIDRMPPYWKDPESFLRLSRVLNVTDVQPGWMLERAEAKGVKLTMEERASKTFAAKLAPLIEDFFAPPKKADEPAHTAGIVVIDRDGNVAALVHSINTVNWGTTGMVVDGIPIADPAAIGHSNLAAIKPGEPVRNSMTPMIATKDGKPVLAVAITGYAIRRETVRLILGVIGNKVGLETLMLAPPLVVANGSRQAEFMLPDVGYDSDFLARLRAAGAQIEIIPKQQARNLRGIGVLATIDLETGKRRGIEVNDLFAFSVAY